MLRKFHLPLFFLLCLMASTGFSQKVQWSIQMKENKKAPYLRILGADEDGNFFLLRSNISMETDREKSGFRSRYYELEYYNAGLNPVWQRELVTSYENGHVADVQMNNGRIVVTGYVYDRKAKKYTFYSQLLTNEGRWAGPAVELDSFNSSSLDEDNKPGILNSRDESLMAFTYRKIKEDKSSQIFSVIVLDTTLNQKYRKEIEIPYSADLYFPVSFQLTNAGNYYILGTHFTTEKKVKSPGEMYYEIFGYSFQNDQTLRTEIKSENRFLTDAGFSADNLNHRIIVAGFYSDKTTYSVAGVFYNSFSEDSLIQISELSSPFPPTYLQKFLGEQREGKTKELVNYSIDRLLLRKDGGAGIIAESFSRVERSYWDYYMQTFVYHYYYHYGNIMVLSINPDGNILWNNVISKDQNSVDDSGYSSSYIGAVAGGKFVTIYNKYISDESSVLMTSIDGKGEQKTDVLFNETEKITIVPRSARQIDDDTILMPVYRQNHFYIVKILVGK